LPYDGVEDVIKGWKAI